MTINGDQLGTDIHNASKTYVSTYGIPANDAEYEDWWQAVGNEIADNSNAVLKTTDPGVGDDSNDGYAIGSEWINTTKNRLWRCLDASVGAAIWIILIGKPSFELYNDSTTGTTGTGWHLVPLDTAADDNWDGADLTNDRYIIPLSGVWQFNGNVGILNVTSEQYIGGQIRAGANILVQVLTIHGSVSADTYENNRIISTLRRVTAGDYITLYRYLGSAENELYGRGNTFLHGFLVRQ
jgi:hypothetical protein